MYSKLKSRVYIQIKSRINLPGSEGNCDEINKGRLDFLPQEFESPLTARQI